MVNKNHNFDYSLLVTYIGMACLLVLQLLTGNFIFLFLIFLIPLSIYSLFVSFRDRSQFKVRLTKFYLWFITIALSIGCNFFINKNIRINADQVVEKIESYKLINGQFPINLEQINLENQNIDKRISIILNAGGSKNTRLSYTNTYIVTYIYDFKKKKWNAANW